MPTEGEVPPAEGCPAYPRDKEMDALMQCLKSLLKLDDNYNGEEIVFTIPSDMDVNTIPRNIKWKRGAVTEFVTKNEVLINDDPRDFVLEELLKGYAKPDTKNSKEPSPPPAPATSVEDYKSRFTEASTSNATDFNKLAQFPASTQLPAPADDQNQPGPGPSGTATSTTTSSYGRFNFSKSRRRFSPPRFISTGTRTPSEVAATVAENMPGASATFDDNFAKPSLFTTTTRKTKAVGRFYQGRWKKSKLDDDDGEENSSSERPFHTYDKNTVAKVDPMPAVPFAGPSSSQVPAPDIDSFKSAKEQLIINDRSKGIKRSGLESSPARTPGLKRPCHVNGEKGKADGPSDNPEVNELMLDERMKNVDPSMVEAILNEVIEVGSSTDWDDIAGLSGAKGIIREIIIWPMLRPDIFTGLRGPPKGILLFGPPGTGKTMIGRLIATQSKSTFFNISASSLTSKWIGDGEKMVRTLFQVARVKQPSVIFIDEIDSILTQRNDTEHESSRRLKTEFLIQFDGCGSNSEDRILVIGVTNRPQELDEAARRRLVKRIYIPLPDLEGRLQLVQRVVKDQTVNLTKSDFEKIAEMTEGYSGADVASLCKEAAYGPIRDVGVDICDISADEVRPMELTDFSTAIKHVKASVAAEDLTLYENWDRQFGCHV